MTAVRVNRLHYPVTALGPGRRLGIWLQGCSIGCKGCVSRDTWDPTAAEPMLIETLIERAEELCSGDVDGVTVTGGEPFDQADALPDLFDALRTWLASGSARDADILAYSGYEIADLQVRAPRALAGLDAVIVGPYMAARPSESAWWGSGNQELVPLSNLGRELYPDPTTFPSTIQVDVDQAGRVWLIGVPRPAALREVESTLTAAGIRLKDVSWRP